MPGTYLKLCGNLVLFVQSLNVYKSRKVCKIVSEFSSFLPPPYFAHFRVPVSGGPLLCCDRKLAAEFELKVFLIIAWLRYKSIVVVAVVVELLLNFI